MSIHLIYFFSNVKIHFWILLIIICLSFEEKIEMSVRFFSRANKRWQIHEPRGSTRTIPTKRVGPIHTQFARWTEHIILESVTTRTIRRMDSHSRPKRKPVPTWMVRAWSECTMAESTSVGSTTEVETSTACSYRTSFTHPKLTNKK